MEERWQAARSLQPLQHSPEAGDHLLALLEQEPSEQAALAVAVALLEELALPLLAPSHQPSAVAQGP